MLKNYVREQNLKTRERFYRENHREYVKVDYENIDRKKQTLSNLPAYQRLDEEEKENGRNDYETNRGVLDCDSMAKIYIDPNWKPEDVWEKSKNDLQLRKKLYSHAYMKSQNSGLSFGKSKRYIPTERTILIPPPVNIQIDSGKAHQEYNMKTLIADRDPRWRKDLPTEVLIKREKDVYIPENAQRSIQKMSTAPIRQNKLNILQQFRPEDIPDRNSGYPIDFNPDIAKHIPEKGIKGEFLNNPAYYEWLKTKVDIDLEPYNLKRLGITNQQQRFYDENPGIPTSVNNEPQNIKRLGITNKEERFYDENPGIPTSVNTNPHNIKRLGITNLEQRFYDENPGIPTSMHNEPNDIKRLGITNLQERFHDQDPGITTAINNEPHNIKRLGITNLQERFYDENPGIPTSVNNEMHNIKRLGITNKQERFYDEDPGIMTSVNNEPIYKFKTQGLKLEELNYQNANQIPNDAEMESFSTRSYDDRIFENRKYLENREIDINSKESFNSRINDSLQQSQIYYKDGNQIINSNLESQLPRNKSNFQENHLSFLDHTKKEIDGNLDNKKSNNRDEYRQLIQRNYNGFPGEYESFADQKITSKTNGLQFEKRNYSHLQKLESNVENKKSFSTMQGLQYHPLSFKDTSRNEINNVQSTIQNTRNLSIEEKDVFYRDSEKLQVNMENNNISQLNMLGHIENDVQYPVHSKVDIDGRKFKTLDSRGLYQKPVEYMDPLTNGDINVKIQDNNRNDTIQDLPLLIQKPSKLTIDTENKKSATQIGIRDLNPRSIEGHKNADMNLPYIQGSKFNRILKDNPRDFAEINKPDYEDVIHKSVNRDLQIRGLENKTRSCTSTPIKHIDIDSPHTRVPKKRANESKPSTPRQTPIKRNVEEIDRIKKLVNLPNPF